MDTYIHVIARAYNGYSSKFGIPRQSGRADSVLTRIVLEPQYSIDGVFNGIEQWSHLWLIWQFSENKGWSPTVRPPRLGGNKHIGVFATRSPFRPNNLGLSSVRLVKVEKTPNEGTVLWVSGADLMNGTPIYDIKPYLPYTDIHTDATNGFAADDAYHLQVEVPDDVRRSEDSAFLQTLTEILREDPRPAYHNDKDRVYKFEYDNRHICFRVENHVAYVLSVRKIV